MYISIFVPGILQRLIAVAIEVGGIYDTTTSYIEIVLCFTKIKYCAKSFAGAYQKRIWPSLKTSNACLENRLPYNCTIKLLIRYIRAVVLYQSIRALHKLD